MRRKSFLACIFAALVINACTSTKIISSWKPADASPQKFQKMLVIGMMGARDQEIRQQVEEAMVQQLQANGINAVAATKQYGPRTFRNMTEEQAVKMVNSDNFDGVMVIELIDKQKEKNYIPGYVNYTPFGIVGGRWWPHYMVLYDRIYSPGYYTTSTTYSLEVNLYDTKKDMLEYSAQAKSFDPGSAAALAKDFSKTVVDDMLKKGVVMK
jgi:hypothetical protein